MAKPSTRNAKGKHQKVFHNPAHVFEKREDFIHNLTGRNQHKISKISSYFFRGV